MYSSLTMLNCLIQLLRIENEVVDQEKMRYVSMPLNFRCFEGFVTISKLKVSLESMIRMLIYLTTIGMNSPLNRFCFFM